MKHNDLYFAWVLLGTTVFAISAQSLDWPQWQGPDRNAISKETGLLQEWPKDGPPLAWKMTGIGTGYGAPSIAAGRIFGMSHRGENEVVWALSEPGGKELWVTRLAAAQTAGPPQGKEGSGCTPTVDGERLYVLGRGGDLACLQVGDGQIIWKHNLVTDFGGQAPTWQYNESPLVDGDKVICTPGGTNATFVALDKLTGKTIWTSKMPEASEGATSGNGGASNPDTARRSGGSTAQRSGANADRNRDRGPRREARETATRPQAKPAILIPAGSRWKFLDTGTSAGPDWTKLDFKDAAWREGPAQLGYGDGDEKTRLNDARENYPTYYFRLKFEVKNPGQLKPLVLRLLRDDGAIVYLNGREVVRDNMPSGAVDHSAYAERTTFVEDGFYVHDLKPDRLVAGENVIAVEVHQASATSSDVSFDLELREKVPGQDVVGAPRGSRRGGFGGGRRGFGRGGRASSGAAYASAIAIDFGGQREYVQFTARALVGIAASDGKFLWRYDKPANRMTINCSTPIYDDGHVFAASAYGAGGGLVRLNKNAKGGISAEEVWFSSDMQNHHGGVVLIDGCLYGANGGNSGGYLACLDFATGKVLWDESDRDKRRARKGSVAVADGRLYYRTEQGTLLLVEPNAKEYIERGRFEQPDRTRQPAWTHPVIANGKLYIRDQDTLFCYDVKARGR